MHLRYKCLILDHDDTAVNSTASIHYPAHLAVMRKLRPDTKPIDLDGWFVKNFHPGIMNYLTRELGMNEGELEMEYKVWREFNKKHTPDFFPGFLEALYQYKMRGGIIAVTSHSEKDIIEKHYNLYTGKQKVVPDIVFGWDDDEKKRKPSPWPVMEILKKYRLDKEEALIVDDLKPAVLMSRNTGVPVAAAGWSHDIPQIKDYMQKNCLAYFKTIGDFRNFILT
jgi:beta-phosphoglucomutase-like phosphatase (HAD superfamily)